MIIFVIVGNRTFDVKDVGLLRVETSGKEIKKKEILFIDPENISTKGRSKALSQHKK